MIYSTAPTVTDVRISSTPSHDVDGDGTEETYGRGAKIQVRVTFDKAVDVDGTTGGTPSITIKMDPTYGEKSAAYESGTGTKVLTFSHEVVAENLSTQGVAVLEDTMQLNGGSIKDAADATIDANLAHTGLAARPRPPGERQPGGRHDGAGLLQRDRERDDAGSDLRRDARPGLGAGGQRVRGQRQPRRHRHGAVLSGATVTVTLAAAVPHGEQMVTVSYTSPGTGNNPLQGRLRQRRGGLQRADGDQQHPATAGRRRNATAGWRRRDAPAAAGPARARQQGAGDGGGRSRTRRCASARRSRSTWRTPSSDPDDDDLEYAASSSDPGVAAVELDGAALTVRAAGPGDATITTKAEDPDGATATQWFEVAVRWPETVWYLPPNSDPLRQGFVRVINHSDEAGEATVTATDDAGVEYEPLTLALGPREARHFNSEDLELGNADKGLTGATGPGTGAWRLVVESDEVDVEALAYARAADGFLTATERRRPA